jgi:hypothetical protein
VILLNYVRKAVATVIQPVTKKRNCFCWFTRAKINKNVYQKLFIYDKFPYGTFCRNYTNVYAIVRPEVICYQ